MNYCLNKEIKTLLKANFCKNLCFLRNTNSDFSSAKLRKHLKPLNVLFFGTDKFATTCLNELITNKRLNALNDRVINKVEVVCVSSSSDLPIRQFVKKNELLLYQWPDLPSIEAFDVGVVVSFGKLISSSVISSFPYGMVNVHGSFLPQLRGAAPIARAIERGFKSTGVTIMQVQPNYFDRGFILDRSQPVAIEDNMNATELLDKLALIGAELCLKTLSNLPEKLSNAIPQTSDDVSYAPKLCAKDRNVDWNILNSEEVLNKFRAYGFNKLMNPRCVFDDASENILLNLVELHPCSAEELSYLPSDSPPGTVLYRKRFKKLFIACKTGYISCSRLSFVGGDSYSAVGFRNAYLLKRIRRNETILFKSI